MFLDDSREADSAQGRSAVWLGAVLIALAVVGVYWSGLHGEFVLDDQGWIVENEGIRRLWPPSRELLAGPRPVLSLSLAVSYAMGGVDPFYYHLFNVCVHVLAALTLFGVLRRTLRRVSLPEGLGSRTDSLAFAAALLWSVHPLLTEAVTYVVQRCESMMGLFLLLALYCTIRGVEHDERDARAAERPALRAGLRWYAGAVAACAAGMATKEVMVVAPVLLYIYDVIFLAGSWREAARRRWGLYVGLAATWGVLAAARMGGGDAGDSAGFGRCAVTPAQYALTQPEVVLHYLRLAFRPTPLCLDYAWPPVSGVAQAVPAMLCVAVLLGATVWGLLLRRAWAFPGAWFFLILAPTSSVMPINDLAAERRMYLPLAAVTVAVVAVIAISGAALLRRALAEEGQRRRTGLVMSVVLVTAAAAGMGWLTVARNGVYASALGMWQDVIRQRPGNPRAWYNAGVVLGKAGRKAEALACYTKSIEAWPDYERRVYYNRGEVLASMGYWEAAIVDYSRAIEMDPAYARAWVNRGVARTALRQFDAAVQDLTEAIRVNPRLAEAWYNRGVARAGRGDNGEAISDYTRVIELKPDYATAYYGRGNARFQLNAPAEAAADYSRALETRPDYAEALQNRAVAYLTAGDYDRAWADVRQLRAMGVKPAAVVRALEQASGRKE